MQTHLFRYNHDGKVWQMEIVAADEADARARLAKLAYATHLGVRIAQIPIWLSPLAPVIVWLRNAATKLTGRFALSRHG